MESEGLILEQVTKDNLSHVWVQVRPLMNKVLIRANGELNSEDIRRAALEGKVQLFVAHDKETVHMAMATEYVTYPRFTSLRVIALGGKTAGALRGCVRDFWPKIIEWAQAQGVTKIEASCHPSMVRLLTRYGFYPKYTTVFLDVE